MAQRTTELALVLAAAERAKSGATNVVIVEGEPGIGKSWLLRTAAASLAGFTQVSGVDAPSGRPSLLIIDDAHELEPEAAALLAAQLLRSRRNQLLALVAARTGESALVDALKPESSRGERGAVIELRGFSTQQTAELAAESGIVALETPRAELLTELTDGNPLHLMTAFAALGQRLHVSVPRELPVPAIFDPELSKQLAAVSRPGRWLLEVLAVVDEPIARPLAVEIGERLGESVSIDDALASGLVEATDALGQRQLSIASARVRSGIRRSLAPARLRTVHAAIAESMTGSARLDHRLAATESSDDDLANELEAEARRWVDLGRYSEAARYFSTASGVSSESPVREQRLLTACAFAFYADDAELASTLAPAVARCSPSLARELALGGIGYLVGDFLEALALVRIARATYPLEPLSLFGSAVIASLELAVVDLPATIATSEVVGASADEPAAARLLLTRGFALWIAGAPDASDATIDLLVDLPLNRPERADALTTLAQREFYGGDSVRALATVDRAIESARASSAQHILPLGIALRAHIVYSLGQWDAAMDDANAVLTHTSASRNGNHDVLAHSVIAMISAHSGELAFAERSVRVARRLGVERPLPQHIAAASIAAAVVEREGGHPHAVIHALAPMLEGSLGLGLTSTGFTGWRAMHAEALIALGSLDRAQTVVAQFETEPGVQYFGYPGWLRGLLAAARGRPEAADELRQAISDGDESVTPFAHALALRALAGVLADGSDEATAAATAATRLFSRLGATAYLADSAEPTAPAGVTSLDRWSTLTPRESETAVLASEGFLNREIAALMHVSVKTVEHHVANALAKLGLRSRRDLERARAV